MDISKLTRRFEIAVGNFGRSCVDMQGNEKAFQAWYAASVIQEFGLARVYREIHLWKSDLRESIEPNLSNFLLSTGNGSLLNQGNELFPDLSVTWEPDLDARHSSTRRPDLRSAAQMLNQIAIVSEFKVTGSTNEQTSWAAIQKDLLKLSIFASAQQSLTRLGLVARPFAAYMVILHNHPNQRGNTRFERATMESRLSQLALSWPQSVPVPTVMLIRGSSIGGVVDIYRNFSLMEAVH